MMHAKKKYVSDVKSLLLYSSDKEKAYLKDIENRLNDFDDISYEQLVEQLGEPAQVVEYFYSEEDSSVIAKKVSNDRKKVFLLGAVFLIMIVVVAYFLKDYMEIRSSNITHEVEYIEILEEEGE